MRFHRTLADLLAGLNALLGIAIVVFCTVAGFYWARLTGDNLTFGAGMGLVGGLIAAALVCGVLAIGSLIERHLRLIADDVEEMRSRAGDGPQ